MTRCHFYYRVLLFQMADFLDYNGSITTEASEYFTSAATFSNGAYIAIVSVCSVIGMLIAAALIVVLVVFCLRDHNRHEHDQGNQFAVAYISHTDSSNNVHQVHGIENLHPGYDGEMRELSTISTQHEHQPEDQGKVQNPDPSQVLYKTRNRRQ